MIAPPQATWQHGELTFSIQPPEKALDVLEADVYLMTNLYEHMDTLPRAQDLEALQRWCAEHVVGVEGNDAPANPGWGGLNDEQKRTYLDTELNWSAVGDLKNAVIELAALPEKLVGQVRKLWKIGASGGCDCPVCEDRQPPTAENIERWCLYGEFDDAVERVVNVTASFGETPALDAPWWLYQLQQAQARGRNMALREQRKKRERREEVDDILKKRGRA